MGPGTRLPPRMKEAARDCGGPRTKLSGGTKRRRRRRRPLAAAAAGVVVVSSFGGLPPMPRCRPTDRPTEGGGGGRLRRRRPLWLSLREREGRAPCSGKTGGEGVEWSVDIKKNKRKGHSVQYSVWREKLLLASTNEPNIFWSREVREPLDSQIKTEALFCLNFAQYNRARRSVQQSGERGLEGPWLLATHGGTEG